MVIKILKKKIPISILGLLGGLLCCCGDVLLDLKGSDNQKLGTSN